MTKTAKTFKSGRMSIPRNGIPFDLMEMLIAAHTPPVAPILATRDWIFFEGSQIESST